MANVDKFIRHENGPRRRLRGPFHLVAGTLVALERVWSNNFVTDAHDDAFVTGRLSSVVSPARQRRRITAKLRADVVEAYESGQTSRQAAEELALGRTTVLRILKEAGVRVRPPGRKC